MPEPRRTAGGEEPSRASRASLALRPARGEAAPPCSPSFRPLGGCPGPGSTEPTGPREPRPRDREVPELGAALVSLPPGMGVVDTCSQSQSRPGQRLQLPWTGGLGGRPEPAELLKVPVDPLLPPAHCRRLG